jgi:hypothetical protein
MAEERAQRRLAAILAADVVGYSHLMEPHARRDDQVSDLGRRQVHSVSPGDEPPGDPWVGFSLPATRYRRRFVSSQRLSLLLIEQFRTYMADLRLVSLRTCLRLAANYRLGGSIRRPLCEPRVVRHLVARMEHDAHRFEEPARDLRRPLVTKLSAVTA